MRIIIVLLFLLTSFVSLAQPEDAVVVNVDGISYYQHTVEKGNTLYGLHEMYGASVEEIIKLNPELEDGLKIGQTIRIPIHNDPVPKTVEYKVKKKETLYGISKKFNVSIDELIRLNPSLKDGLKKGQVILVAESITTKETETETEEEVLSTNPFVVDTITENGVEEEVIVSFEDSIVEHVVLEGETMYSISKRFMVSIDEIMKNNDLKSTTVQPGQILIIPLKEEQIDKVEVKKVPNVEDTTKFDALIFEEKESYKIVILLPFYLEHGKNYSKYVSDLSTQFYMGAKLAIDSLKELGLNAEIHVFDTKNDSMTISSILKKPLFNDVDLIIGPLLKKEVRQVASFCKENRIRMVCPVSINQVALENNQLVYAAVASSITLERGMANYLSKKPNTDRVIVVKPSDENSLPYYNAFINAYRLSQTDHSPVLIEATAANFNVHIQKKNRSHIVVPTVDKMVAMKFVNDLNKSSFRAHPGNIQIYGMKEWLKFTEINTLYKNKYNLHVASPNYLNYDDVKVVALNKTYRSVYSTDLPKMAIQGYDVTLFYISNLLLGKENIDLMMNDFIIHQVSEKDGYENAKVFIVKYEEFNLLNVD